MTNAPNVSYLTGDSLNIGGSYGTCVEYVPVVAGVDFNIIPHEHEFESGKYDVYYGCTTNAGIGTPGAEGHFGIAVTWDMPSSEVNVFEVFDIYERKIDEW